MSFTGQPVCLLTAIFLMALKFSSILFYLPNGNSFSSKIKVSKAALKFVLLYIVVGDACWSSPLNTIAETVAFSSLLLYAVKLLGQAKNLDQVTLKSASLRDVQRSSVFLWTI
jgi:hypothetical protein